MNGAYEGVLRRTRRACCGDAHDADGGDKILMSCNGGGHLVPTVQADVKCETVV